MTMENFELTNKRQKMIIVATIDQQVESSFKNNFAESEYELHFVRRGLEAILQMLEKDVDLLILDPDMNGIIGIEIIPVIRKLRPRLPVILISEDFTFRLRKIAAEQGITYQTIKPRRAAEISNIVSVSQKIIEKKELMPVN